MSNLFEHCRAGVSSASAKDTNKPGAKANLFAILPGRSIFGAAKDTKSRAQKQTHVCFCRDGVSTAQPKYDFPLSVRSRSSIAADRIYRLLTPKAVPKVFAGHLRRDRTKAVTERSRKTPLVARSLRAFQPLSDPLPPPVQCGGCCALHATMVYSDVILLYSI